MLTSVTTLNTARIPLNEISSSQFLINLNKLPTENKLTRLHFVDALSIPSQNKVALGASVTLLNLETYETVEYKIVGEDEANPKCGLVSLKAPLAQTLIGKFLGKVVEIKAPRGEMKYKICKIEYD